MVQKNILLVFVLLLSGPFLWGQPESPERGFVSTSIARNWEEGLLSGNGTIGADVLGRPLEETVIFTHERSFMPKYAPVVPPDQSEHLGEIRDLVEKGQYREADRLRREYAMGTYGRPDCFVPVCDLNISMKTGDETTVRNYARSVDFETGETKVSWSDGNTSYERRLFVSRADGIAVLKIKSGKKGQVDCDIRFNRRTPDSSLPEKYIRNSSAAARFLKDFRIEAGDSFLYYSHAFTKAYPGGVQSVEGVALLKAKGGVSAACSAGEMSANGRDVQYSVRGADEVMVLVDIEPDFVAGHSNAARMKDRLNGIKYTYDQLLDRHAKIHGELFNRMYLDLGGGKDRLLTTEELFRKSSLENTNTALLEKEFDAGRYNILSSTGTLPPVLQGVWGGTYVPDWQSDYTHDGNVPSAIASMLMGNTPELMLPYISYIESLVPFLETNARNLFGCRGILMPIRSSSHGYYNQASVPTVWVGGAPWAAHFFYDYYLYTGDREFLKKRALPFMEKVALFFEDYLYAGPDGKYIFSPSLSPENNPEGIGTQLTCNPTMDVAAVKELFRNLISASKILDINRERIPVWEKILSGMPDYMIDKNGMFKEWLVPELQNNDNHRHSSHLYPLFDNFPSEFSSRPELVEAVRKSVNYKMEKHWHPEGTGFMSFGLVQLGMTGASIGDKFIVENCLKHLSNRFWLGNMASMHNPRSLFNMDISGGMPAVIIKMLVYSDPGSIRLLPALPDIWSDRGEAGGILCRGQILISRLEWNSSEVRVSLISPINQKIILTCGKVSQSVSLKARQKKTIKFNR